MLELTRTTDRGGFKERGIHSASKIRGLRKRNEFRAPTGVMLRS